MPDQIIVEANEPETMSSEPSVDTSASTDDVGGHDESIESAGADEVSNDLEGSGVDAEGDVVEEEGYAPGKFKVDGKEHDFDDKLKPFLTKENEPLIRELVEKAHGIDSIKVRHEEVKGERDSFRDNLVRLATDVRGVQQAAQQKDFGSVMDALGINFDDMAKHVYQELKTQEELPEHLRHLYHENKRFARQQGSQEKATSGYQNELVAARAEAMALRLDTAVASPQIQDTVADFEATHGEGSFRQGVMEWAAARENATGKSLDPKEAVQGYLKIIGRTPVASKPAQTVTTPTKKVVSSHKASTIPKVTGTAAGSIGQKPKTLDDLRSMGKNFPTN